MRQLATWFPEESGRNFSVKTSIEPGRDFAPKFDDASPDPFGLR